jgi:hypothetical protein
MHNTVRLLLLSFTFIVQSANAGTAGTALPDTIGGWLTKLMPVLIVIGLWFFVRRFVRGRSAQRELTPAEQQAALSANVMQPPANESAGSNAGPGPSDPAA